MIVNVKQSFDKGYRFVMFSHYPFYLTGSKFFGNYMAHSDNDYFTMTSDIIKEDLVAAGFTKLHKESTGYLDNTIDSIYRHVKDRIDVQLLKTESLVNNKDMLQMSIKNNKYFLNYFNSLSKNAKREFWMRMAAYNYNESF